MKDEWEIWVKTESAFDNEYFHERLFVYENTKTFDVSMW